MEPAPDDNGIGVDRDEEMVRDDAVAWFEERIRLMAWIWDESMPGPCEPSVVVLGYETLGKLPRSVSRVDPGRMMELLQKERRRDGRPKTQLPNITPCQDRHQRTVCNPFDPHAIRDTT